ncbi:uncharacterized protein at4g28440 [Phtheirospermum japonicum]|uniref:Uncharacterized protein at4g28440 n=1 Tax=Phtheirospermum japonicum TaxID=374723 RepID=A0A830B4Y9_9LAMI|nr:uncharacterized protein at4g28440 [Phtheirospermum japonicum]
MLSWGRDWNYHFFREKRSSGPGKRGKHDRSLECKNRHVQGINEAGRGSIRPCRSWRDC